MADKFGTAGDNVVETPWVRRVSWGSIIAGAFVALGIQLTLSFLGLAIGFWSLSPYGEQNPGGTTIGAAVWFAVSGIVSLFAGGWVTGRLSGEFHRIDKILNGLVLWGIVISASVFMMTTTASALVSGAFGLLGSGIAATGRAATAAAPVIGEILPGTPIGDLQNEIEQLLQQAQQASPQERQQIQREIGQIGQAISQLVREGEISSQNRRAVTNILANRTDMSQQQADSAVNAWTQVAQENREQILQQADAVTNRAAQASAMVFVVLLLDAVAAALGSAIARNPDRPPAAATRVPYQNAA